MKLKAVFWIILILIQLIMLALISFGIFRMAATWGLGTSGIFEDRFPYEIFGLLIFWLCLFLFMSFMHLLSLWKKPKKPYIHPKTKKPVGSLRGRIIASIIDGLILLPLSFSSYLIDILNVWSLWLCMLYFIGVQFIFLYDFLFDWQTGQTIGKKILHIKLFQMNGKKVDLLHASMRSLLAIIPALLNIGLLLSIIPVFSRMTIDFTNTNYKELLYRIDSLIPLYQVIGTATLFIFTIDCLFLIFRKDRRALHDIISNTIVLQEKK